MSSPEQTNPGSEPSATSSSLSQRVRSLGARRRSTVIKDPLNTIGATSTSSASGNSPQSRQSSYHAIRMDPEALFRDGVVRDLDQGRSAEERKQAAKAVSASLQDHSVDTLTAIWTAAEDLTDEGASLEAREAGLILLQGSVVHSGLNPTERMKFFEMTVVPVDATLVDLQISALRSLTYNGHDLEPFQEPLVKFLCSMPSTQFESVQLALKRARGISERRPKVELPEERGLRALLKLMADVFRFNPEAVPRDDLTIILDQLMMIAEKTTQQADIKESLLVIEVVVSVYHIPPSSMPRCVRLLCAVTGGIIDLHNSSWGCLLELLRSRDSESALETLYEILQQSSHRKQSPSVCGALFALEHLVTKNGADKLPLVSLSQLLNSMRQLDTSSRRICKDCMQVVIALLGQEVIVGQILQSDLNPLIQVVLALAGDKTPIDDMPNPLTLRDTFVSGTASGTSEKPAQVRQATFDISETIIPELKQTATIFVHMWPRFQASQRALVAGFFNILHSILPSACTELLVSHMDDERLLYPESPKWDLLWRHMLDMYLLDDQRDPKIRCKILDVMKATAPKVESEADKTIFRSMTLEVLEKMKGKTKLPVVNSLAGFAVLYSEIAASLEDFENILNTLWDFLPKGGIISTSSVDAKPELLTNTVSVSLVTLFLHCLRISASKTVLVYKMLVKMANARELSASGRLPALKLLMRLRCDTADQIVITSYPDSLGLAVTLSRTEASALPTEGYTSVPDRTSLVEDHSVARVGRSSAMGYGSSRANTRSKSRVDQTPKPTPPLWMYPGGPGLPEDPPSQPSLLVKQHRKGTDDKISLRLSDWLVAVIEILQQAESWEVYSYVLVHLPSQLSNPSLFSNAVPHIQMLRNVITSQLQGGRFHEPPANTGVKKGDVALCLLHALSMLLGYSEHFARAEQDDIVRAILACMGSWDRAAKVSIQALAICCHQIPRSITRSLIGILNKMAQIITQSHLAMDILEFLGGLGRLPDVYVNLTEEELRKVFAICVRYLEHSREQSGKQSGTSTTMQNHPSHRLSGVSGDSASASDSTNTGDVHKDLPQYVFALAYHVLTIWFLSLRLADRCKHVGWITKNLAFTDAKGNVVLEEQSQVTLDMMHRTAYSDLGETIPSTPFSPSDGKILRKTWLLGLSVVTVDTATGTGLTQITKRQASGTTFAMYQQQTAPLPPHQVPAPTDVMSAMHGPESRLNIFPNHVFLQLTSNIAPTPTPMEAICLPDDEATKRAISAFDRNDTVDGYKVGVIYIGNGQTKEAEILANDRGSKAFDLLLAGLGTKVPLKGAMFNTQGLSRENDSDGTHTYAWRDRVAEIVFHVPTMMPTNLTHDPQCVNKKQHIGNDFVNIIFNESGLPFKFDTFPSQFNYVNIVITPEALFVPSDHASSANQASETPTEGTTASDKPPEKQSYFTVNTLSQTSFPMISPTASYKLLPLSSLPGLVRQLALNASVFSNVWANREGGEHVSSWRNRLRAIKTLRDRFANTGTSTSAKYPGAKGVKTYVEDDHFKGLVAMGGLAEEEGILSGLDFSRWAGPNPPLG